MIDTREMERGLSREEVADMIREMVPQIFEQTIRQNEMSRLMRGVPARYETKDGV